MACARSSSPAMPARPTQRLSSLPSACNTWALSIPNEKPLNFETSRKASSESKWPRTRGQAFGCLAAMSARRLS
eukprot:3530897-Alexandrium_andersonii.AAC.1